MVGHQNLRTVVIRAKLKSLYSKGTAYLIHADIFRHARTLIRISGRTGMSIPSSQYTGPLTRQSNSYRPSLCCGAKRRYTETGEARFAKIVA